MAIIEQSKRILISPNFYLDEFVPKEIYTLFGYKSIIFVSKQRIQIAEEMRKIYGSIIINSWAWIEGGLNQSGYRVPNSTTGAFYSQHKLNNANDLHFVKFNNLSSEDKAAAYEGVREDILKDPAKFLAMGITTIEAGTWSWLHTDSRNTTGIVPDGKIYVVPYQ